MYSVSCKYRDEAWVVFEAFAGNSNYDPNVSAICAPSISIVNSDLCPSITQHGAIQLEANSIITHYAPLTAVNFAGGALPVITGPLATVPAYTAFHHAQITLETEVIY